jgi:hypothetical protein
MPLRLRLATALCLAGGSLAWAADEPPRIEEAQIEGSEGGVGQLAMRGQEYVVSLKACGRGMVLETLRYADEVHKASSYFRDIGDAKPDPDLLDLASTLIEKKASGFDASEFENRYIEALKGLIAEKIKKIVKDHIDYLKAAEGKNPGQDEISRKAVKDGSRALEDLEFRTRTQIVRKQEARSRSLCAFSFSAAPVSSGRIR